MVYLFLPTAAGAHLKILTPVLKVRLRPGMGYREGYHDEQIKKLYTAGRPDSRPCHEKTGELGRVPQYCVPDIRSEDHTSELQSH